MSALTDLVTLVSRLTDSVKDRKAATELREIQRMIASLQTEQASSHESRIALMTENAELKQYVATFKLRVAEVESRHVQARAETYQFLEHRGAAFKRKPEGGYEPTVYCRLCHGPMVSVEGELPYRCAPCNSMVDFSRQELSRIIGELNAA